MTQAFSVIIHLKNRKWEGGYLWAKDETEANHKLFELYSRIKKYIPDIVTWKIGGEVVGDVISGNSTPVDSFEPYLVYLQLDLLMKDMETMPFSESINWKTMVRFFDSKQLRAECDHLISTIALKRPDLLR